MKDMKELMNEAFDGIQKEGFIEKTVKAQIEKTIASLISDTFRDYSDFGKELKKAIKNEIKIDFSNLSLGAYSATITTMIGEIIKEKMNEDSRKEVERFLVSLESNNIPKELKITDMVKRITEIFSDNYYLYEGIEEHEGFEFSFHFFKRWPEESGTLGNHYKICIDPEEYKEAKDCLIKIDYDSGDQEIDKIDIDNKEIMKGRFYSTRKYELEGYLFQLYANKSKLINNADEVETYVYGEYED